MEERTAQLQQRLQALEAAKEHSETQMQAETLKRDDFERAALAERKRLQQETEEANWESARLEKVWALPLPPLQRHPEPCVESLERRACV